jgi:hypothetical protein
VTKLSTEPSEKLRLLDKRNITIHNPSREVNVTKKIVAFLKMKKKFHARIGETERQSYLIWSEKRRKETA